MTDTHDTDSQDAGRQETRAPGSGAAGLDLEPAGTARALVPPRCLVVAISNPGNVVPLTALASDLSPGPHDEVVVAHVVTVPRQMSLSSARASREVARGTALLRDAIDAAALEGRVVDGLVKLSRSVADGLASAVESRAANVLLVGWSDTGSETAREDLAAFDRLMHRVAKAVPCDLIVARLRGEARRSVLVPLAVSAHLPLVARTVRALARAGSEIRFLHVVRSEADRAMAATEVAALMSRHGLDDVGTLDVVVAEDTAAEVISRAAAVDLAVIGAVTMRPDGGAMFGAKAEPLADRAGCSVLIVRAAAE